MRLPLYLDVYLITPICLLLVYFLISEYCAYDEEVPLYSYICFKLSLGIIKSMSILSY